MYIISFKTHLRYLIIISIFLWLVSAITQPVNDCYSKNFPRFFGGNDGNTYFSQIDYDPASNSIVAVGSTNDYKLLGFP
jgi:hypothetical protein